MVSNLNPMNTINPQSKIMNINSYQTAIAPVNTSKNKATSNADSFIKSATSLVPETYTIEDAKSPTRTEEVKDIDLKALTQEEFDKYFGYVSSGGKITEYLPIANASDDVKKAWIATMDYIMETTDPMYSASACLDLKDGLVMGNRETILSPDDLGKTNTMNFDVFKKAIQQTIEDNFNGKYTYREGPNMGNVIDGFKEYAGRLEKYLDIFEDYFKQYSK